MDIEMNKIRSNTLNEVKRVGEIYLNQCRNDHMFGTMMMALDQGLDELPREAIGLLLARQQDEINTLKKQVNALAALIADS